MKCKMDFRCDDKMKDTIKKMCKETGMKKSVLLRHMVDYCCLQWKEECERENCIDIELNETDSAILNILSNEMDKSPLDTIRYFLHKINGSDLVPEVDVDIVDYEEVV